MSVIVTDHAKKRVKDRLGLSKNTADKVAQKALENGIEHKDTSGSLKRYMDGLYLKHKNANNMRVYNRKVYLFKGKVLITIIDLPNHYIATVDKIQKKKEGTRN